MSHSNPPFNAEETRPGALDVTERQPALSPFLLSWETGKMKQAVR